MSARYKTSALMTETVVNAQPAFILRHRPYRESSLILELLTRDFGMISLIAKGVRKTKSKTVGLLLPFNALLLCYQGKSSLKNLTQVDTLSSPLNLNGLKLYCGFYLNELICAFCQKEDPYPEVFANYQASLTALAAINLDKLTNEAVHVTTETFSPLMQIEAVLRRFEIKLIQHIGYALAIDCDMQLQTAIKADKRYHFIADQGVYEDSQGTYSGKTLIALQQQQFSDAQSLTEAKQLMRTVINFHLQGKTLRSRTLLSQIYKQL